MDEETRLVMIAAFRQRGNEHLAEAKKIQGDKTLNLLHLGQLTEILVHITLGKSLLRLADSLEPL